MFWDLNYAHFTVSSVCVQIEKMEQDHVCSVVFILLDPEAPVVWIAAQIGCCIRLWVQSLGLLCPPKQYPSPVDELFFFLLEWAEQV